MLQYVLGGSEMEKNITERILLTATSLFAEIGFANVTIKQLAHAANINPAAISYYFGGKETLYQEVLRYQFSPAIQALQEVTNCRLSATEQLLAYAEAITTVQHKQPFLTSFWKYRLNHHAAIPNCFIINEYTVQLYQRIVSALSYGISQNEFLPDLELYPTAFVLLEMMHGRSIPVWILIEPGLSDSDTHRCTLQAVRHYLRGINRCVVTV